MKGHKAVKILCLLLAVIIAATSCGTETSDTSVLQYAPKEEDRLVVYTSHKEEVYWPIIKEFEERTGIWVEVVSGGTNELLTRQSGCIWGLLCPLLLPGLGAAGLHHALHRRALDSLFRPSGGADLQHKAGLSRSADLLGRPLLPCLAGADRLL